MKNLIIFTGCLFLSLISYAQEINKLKLDSLFTSLEENNKGMGTLSIFKQGEEIYTRSIGFSNLEQEVKANKDTRYRIGSITKMFTATMIMQLVDEGKLSLDSKVAEYYPELPGSEKITIEHLLRHQSGLFNITSEENHKEWKVRPHSKEELLQKIKENGIVFEAGQKAAYSNTNYIVLTFILENIDKMPYPEILEKRILKPLNLKNTYYGGKIDNKKSEAYSYEKLSSWTKTQETDLSIPLGAGGIVSTPRDLNYFILALYNAKLTSKESLLKMQEISHEYGIGMFPIPFFMDEKILGHTGGIDGFASMAAYLPEHEIAVTFSSNAVDFPSNQLMEGIFSILLNKEYQLPQLKTLDLTSEQLQPFSGTYGGENFPLKIKVFVENKILMGQGTGQPAFPMEAIAENKFKFDRARLTMEFFPAENKMIFSQGSNTVQLQRE